MQLASIRRVRQRRVGTLRAAVFNEGILAGQVEPARLPYDAGQALYKVAIEKRTFAHHMSLCNGETQPHSRHWRKAKPNRGDHVVMEMFHELRAHAEERQA